MMFRSRGLVDDPILPERLPVERQLELVRLLRNGDLSNNEELARSHMRLALSIAGRYARKAPHKRYDFASEAYKAIAYALRKAPQKLRDDNLTAWIASCVHKACYKFMVSDHVIGVPLSTILNRRKKGLVTNTLRAVNNSVLKAITVKQSTVRDLRETIYSCATCDVEIVILEMREMGYIDREIADKLNLSNSFISKTRIKMEKRFERIEHGT